MVLFVAVICANAHGDQEAHLRIQVRIAADRTIDADLVAAALGVHNDIVRLADGRAAMWVQCEPKEIEASGHAPSVMREGSILVLINPDDVDTNVEHIARTQDAFGRPAMRLIIPAASTSRLFEMTRKGLGRICVIILEGHVVQIGELVSPLSGSVVVPALRVPKYAAIDYFEPKATHEAGCWVSARTMSAIAALVPTMIASVIVILRLRRVRVRILFRVGASILGALVGASVLALLTSTHTVVPSRETVTIARHVSLVWLGSGTVVGGAAGYAVLAIICAWRKRRAKSL